VPELLDCSTPKRLSYPTAIHQGIRLNGLVCSILYLTDWILIPSAVFSRMDDNTLFIETASYGKISAVVVTATLENSLADARYALSEAVPADTQSPCRLIDSRHE